ncbi:MAG: hypothetical protein H6Q14_636 [Bacteroidetes bacterium]|jgi:hypothetical protein|nr:hypothetical protein [Bacteroidota bacterium]
MKRQLIPYLILFVLAVTNCDKNNEENGNILLTKTWKRTVIDKKPTSNPAGKILYDAILECEKDDTFTFNADNTLTIHKGLNKCDPTDSNSRVVKYSYDNQKNELIIDGIKYTLSEVSNGQIKYYLPIAHATGYDYLVYILE